MPLREGVAVQGVLRVLAKLNALKRYEAQSEIATKRDRCPYEMRLQRYEDDNDNVNLQ